jgi:hypothetical protein
LKNKGEDFNSCSPFVVGIVEEKTDGSKLVLAISVFSKHFNIMYVLDATCTFHMSPIKHWFTTYNSIDCSSILEINDVACKIIGIGTIRIRMHDRIVRNLTNVRHIPDLKKNLISLSTLDSLGNKCSNEGRFIMVSKVLLVVMKSDNVDGLYFLQGSMLTSSAAFSSLDDLDLDATQL